MWKPQEVIKEKEHSVKCDLFVSIYQTNVSYYPGWRARAILEGRAKNQMIVLTY